jgi:hypothetical protein
MEVVNTPAQGTRSPSKKASDTATRQGGEIAASPLLGAQLDAPFNDPDSIVLAVNPSLEPVRTPPVTESPSSFRGGEELGEKCRAAALIAPVYTSHEALKRRRAREEKGWVAAPVARVPPESPERGDAGARGEKVCTRKPLVCPYLGVHCLEGQETFQR